MIKDDVRRLARRMDDGSPQWLDSREACDLLQIGKSTLAKLRKSGDIPFSRIGRKIRFRKSDLDNYLLKQYSDEN